MCALELVESVRAGWLSLVRWARRGEWRGWKKRDAGDLKGVGT